MAFLGKNWAVIVLERSMEQMGLDGEENKKEIKEEELWFEDKQPDIEMAVLSRRQKAKLRKAGIIKVKQLKIWKAKKDRLTVDRVNGKCGTELGNTGVLYI